MVVCHNGACWEDLSLCTAVGSKLKLPANEVVWCPNLLFSSPNGFWIFLVLGIVFMSSTSHCLGLSGLCIVMVQKVMPLSTWF